MGNELFFIVSVLIVAFLIGFITAWIYWKRKFDQFKEEIVHVKMELDNAKIEYEGHLKSMISRSEYDEVLIKNDLLENEIIDLKRKLLVNSPGTIMADKKENILEDLGLSDIVNSSTEHKDDLKLISGIGPFIEEKLNSVGIYSFKQISHFNDEDVEKINQLIEFFPGRIKREDWVGQARKLYKAVE